MQTQVLLFQVDDRRFGVRCGHVKEVVRAVKLFPLPEPSRLIEGLLNLRGTILPVIDVRSLFGLPARSIRYTDHLVVVDADARLLTLRVDRAVDLVRLESGELQPGQTVAASDYGEAVGKVGDDIVCILDVERLVGLLAGAPGSDSEAGATEAAT